MAIIYIENKAGTLRKPKGRGPSSHFRKDAVLALLQIVYMTSLWAPAKRAVLSDSLWVVVRLTKTVIYGCYGNYKVLLTISRKTLVQCDSPKEYMNVSSV